MENTNSSIAWDRIYHPDFLKRCEIAHQVIFIITSTLTLCAILLIYKKSTHSMGFYKYILVNSVIWNYITELHYYLWDPYSLSPYFLFYSHGIYQWFLPNGFMYLLWTLFMICTATVHSICMTIFYRVSAVSIHSKFFELFNEPKNFILLYIGLLVVLEIGITSRRIIAVLSGGKKDPNILKHKGCPKNNFRSMM
jgi:hypothetical protein